MPQKIAKIDQLIKDGRMSESNGESFKVVIESMARIRPGYNLEFFRQFSTISANVLPKIQK